MSRYVALDRERLTVSTVTKQLTDAKVRAAGIEYALIKVESNGIYESIVGTASSSVGRERFNGDEFEVWTINDLLLWNAVRSGSADAAVELEYFGRKQ